MLLTANRRQRIRSSVVIRIKRLLTGEGNLTIKEGDELSPSDILGKFTVSPGFATFNLAQMLGSSRERVRDYLKKRPGEKIYKGELLAEKSGFFGNKQVKSPTDGVLEEYDPVTGILKMKFLSKEVVLVSGVYGIVENVDKKAGEVEIKTLVTEIYGVFGSGRERAGILRIVGGKGNLMMKHQMTAEYKNTIVVTGALIFADAIKKALEHGVTGIISGGFNARDYLSITGSIEPFNRLGTDIGTSIMATEGFGPISIGEDIYKMVRACEGKYVFLSGNATRLVLPVFDADSIMFLRKAILPKRKLSEHQPELKIEEIINGATVRIIWPPYVGVQGIVIGKDETPTVLPSGISTYLLTIETPLRKIKVPYPNIELI